MNNPNAQIGKLLRQLAQTPQRIKIPDLVVGFKVSDPAKVTAQLKRLEPLIADELKETPLKSASSWTKIEGDEFLVLKLDASLVPWDLLPLGMYEEKPGDLAPLIARLKN